MGVQDNADKLAKRQQAEEMTALYQGEVEAARQSGDKAKLVSVLSKIATIYHEYEAYEKAIATFHEAEKYAREMNNPQFLAAILNNSGMIYDVLGQYEKAIVSLQEALCIAEKLGDVMTSAMMCENIGSQYERMELIPDTIRYYEKSLELYRKAGAENPPEIPEKLAACRKKHEAELSEAISPLTDAFKIARHNGEIEKVAINLLSMGDIYYRFEEYDRALSNYRDAVQEASQIKEAGSSWTAVALENIGTVYAAKGNYAESLHHYQSAEELYRQTGDREGLASCLSNIGSHYYAQNDFIKTLNYYKQALQISEEVGARCSAAVISGNIGFVCETHTQDWQEALVYYGKSLAHYRAAGLEKTGETVRQRLAVCEKKLAK